MRGDLYATAGIGGAPAPEIEPVRKATAADGPELARALAAAFYDDPVAAWIFSDPSRRMARLGRGYELFLRRLYLRHDQCYTTGGVDGGALWLPPGEWRTSLVSQLALLPALARICGRELRRLLRVLAAEESAHPHEPHYYLPFAGVRPDRQGRGIGSALIQPVIDRCDRDGVPAYLEATSERNRALYERHDFVVTSALELPGDGPPLWPMWREPRAPGGR